jgi:hypothetical protein
MELKQPPTIHSTLPAALILALIGWGGLYELINTTRPAVGARWLFFFLGVLAVSGTALPLVAFINRRFQTDPPATIAIIVRQALWIAIYFSTLAWLQKGRILTPTLGIVLGLGIVAIEGLLRSRELSQWKPK